MFTERKSALPLSKPDTFDATWDPTLKLLKVTGNINKESITE